MRKTVLLATLAWACLPGRAWAQPPADCKPNTLNIPSAPYPCILPDNRVMFRVIAPDARKVTVRLGPGIEMSKGPDGLWYGTSTPQVVGFHYYTLSIDGAVVAEEVRQKAVNTGYDANAGKYVDMFKAGVIDPLKVVRGALENAASIAAMILTTECLITDVPEKEKPAPMPPGGGMGMDY